MSSTYRLPRAFWVLLVGTIVNRAGALVQPFLALYLVTQRRMEVERVGRVCALVGLGWICAGPIGGELADRLGRRAALAIAGGLGAAAMIALGLAREPAAIATAAFAVGLCGEMYRPASSAIVTDLVPPAERARAFGLMYWAVNIAFAIATSSAGWLAAVSYWALFVIDAATTLAFAAIVLALVPETRPAALRDPAPSRRTLGFGAPYADREFLGFGVASLVLSTVFHQVSAALPIDMQAHGIGPRSFGLLLASNGVMITIAQPFVGRASAGWPRRVPMAVAALLIGIGLGIPAVLGGSPEVYELSIVVWTAGEIAMAGVAPTIVADMAPPHLRGSYQGAYQVAWGAGGFLAPIVGPFVLARCGAAALWSACAAMGASLALAFMRAVPASRAPQVAADPGR
jgi:MFS family permease